MRYKLRSAKQLPRERNDPSRVAGEAGGKDQECGGSDSGEPSSKMRKTAGTGPLHRRKTLPKPVEGAACSQLVKAGPLLAITDLPQVQ
jgi:hypothetical protein